MIIFDLGVAVERWNSRLKYGMIGIQTSSPTSLISLFYKGIVGYIREDFIFALDCD